MDVKAFVKEVNNRRKVNKERWFTWFGTVEGKKVSIKAYNTWLQVFHVDGVNFSNCMDANVTRFKEDLRTPFK